MEVQEKIRTLREMHHYTQEEMAEKLNISPSAYAKIERGVTRLQIEKLQQIADAFDVKASDLMSSDKNVVVLVNENGDYSANYYSGDDSLSQSLEKAYLTIEHQKELLQQKDREIEALKDIIRLIKSQSATSE